MADLAQLESALIKADAAGDTEGARALAGEVRKMRAAGDTPFVPSGEKVLPSMTSPEVLAGMPLTRFAVGAASPVIGAAQLAANAMGAGKPINEHIAQLERLTQEGRGQLGSQGFDWTQAAGNLVSPAFLKAAQLVPGGLSLVQKILAGTTLGAAGGVTAPVTTEGDFGTQKATQTGAGAAVGAAVPIAAGALGKTAAGTYHSLIEPWATPTAIKGRAYLSAAGDKAQEIVSLLRNPREIVPGSAPTAGEAAVPAGSAEFSALQKQAAAVVPSQYVARSDSQNAARLAALRTVGQDETALKAAEAARSAAAGPLYAAARAGQNADTTPVLAKVNLILAKNPGNRELVTELTNIRKGLDEAGNDPQKVASVLDGIKASLANKDNAFIVSRLSEIKNDLVNAIPGYAAAQAKFATMSAPVNQMQIGQNLERKLVPALSDEARQKAATFAGAVQDAPGTIKRATGAPRFDKLEQVLTPDQMNVVTSIQEDLARGVRFQDLATKGAKAAPDITGAMGREHLPNLLNRHVMLMNAIIGRLEGKVNQKLAAEMAVEMLNPQNTGEALGQAVARQNRNKVLAKIVEQTAMTGSAGAAAQAADINRLFNRSQ